MSISEQRRIIHIIFTDHMQVKVRFFVKHDVEAVTYILKAKVEKNNEI